MHHPKATRSMTWLWLESSSLSAAKNIESDSPCRYVSYHFLEAQTREQLIHSSMLFLLHPINLPLIPWLVEPAVDHGQTQAIKVWKATLDVHVSIKVG